MTRTNKVYVGVSVLAISAVILLTSMAYQAKSQRTAAAEESNPTVKSQENAEGTQITETTVDTVCGYVLKEYDGKMALFRENSAKPYRIFDVDLNTLPDYDREQLKEGITVDTEAQMRSLLEDFTS